MTGSPPRILADASIERSAMATASALTAGASVLLVIGVVVLWSTGLAPMALALATWGIVATAATVNAWRIAVARERLHRAGQEGAGSVAVDRWITQLSRRLHGERLLLALGATLGIAGIIVFAAWRPGTVDGAHGGELIVVAACMLVSFLILVAERIASERDGAIAPEAPGLANLLAIGLAVSLLAAAAAGSCSAGWDLPLTSVPLVRLFDWLIATLVIVTLVDVVVRCGLAWWIPGQRLATRWGADSAVGMLISAATSRQRSLLAQLESSVGIDFREHWLGRALTRRWHWIAAIVLLLVWGSTAITTVPHGRRGIAYLAGAPQGVVHAGLHVHAPWPWGRVALHDHGAVHRVALGERTTAAENADVEVRQMAAVEAPSQASDDRLWNMIHPQEVFFLTAARDFSDLHDGREESVSGSGNRGGAAGRRLELMNLDVVVHYRIGLTDEDLLRYATGIAEHRPLVRRLARELVQIRCSAATPEQLISLDRRRFVAAITDDLQRRLDAWESGISIITIAVEAIHPPLKAAPAFFAAQKAEQEARTEIDIATARAEYLRARAQADVSRTWERARASAAEQSSRADAETIRFAAQVESAEANRASFRFETWLQTLEGAWRGRDVTIVDHRIRMPYGHDLEVGE